MGLKFSEQLLLIAEALSLKSVNVLAIILPLWHHITKQEVLNFSPSLADKVARNTSSYTIEEIASEIAELINAR
jgi:hypothetical protein